MAINTTMTELALERFDWDGKTGKLTAFASDFGPLRDGFWWMQRLYDDAADWGIAIRSAKSGKIERFYLVGEESRDAEGDRKWFRFQPVDRNSRVKAVIIFND